MAKFTAKVTVLENPAGAMKAFANLIIDGVLQVDGWKVFEGKNGAFVKPPSVPGKEQNQYNDTVRFLDWTDDKESATKDKISEVILTAYSDTIDKSSRASAASARVAEPEPPKVKPRPSRATSW